MTVTFTVPAKAMELYNREGQWVVEPGVFRIGVGAASTDIRLRDSYTVTP